MHGEVKDTTPATSASDIRAKSSNPALPQGAQFAWDVDGAVPYRKATKYGRACAPATRAPLSQSSESWIVFETHERRNASVGHAAPIRSAPVVDLAGLAVTVERTPVLRNVTLTVAAGEAIGIVGANGSGKSTLLRVLATLLPPAVGAGRVLGARLGTREVEEVRPEITLLGHGPALYSRLTLRENLTFFCRLTGRGEDGVESALTAVGLRRAADRPADRCSHGMLRRAEFARVLIAAPLLLLLDEAHAGLDPSSAALVEVVVEEVRARNGASVVVSHELDRLAGTTDRIVEIQAGTLCSPRGPGRRLDEVLQ